MLSVATNLIVAVAMVESAGNPGVVSYRHGRPHAYGPLQIRQAALTDLNRHYGTEYVLSQFVANLELSTWAFEAYGLMYGAKTEQEFVELWHFGPEGRKRNNTGDDYVQRVMALFNEYESQRNTGR